MAPKEFEKAMKSLSEDKDKDAEETHWDADELMCEVLVSLGYSAGVEIFRDMDRWYA